MALSLGGVFGKKEQDSKQKSLAQSRTTSVGKQRQTQEATRTSQQQETGAQQTQERILDPQLEASLQKLLLEEIGRGTEAGAGISGTARGQLVSGLVERAGTAAEDISGLVGRVVDASRVRSEEQLRGNLTRLASSAGSSLSSNVTQLGQRERLRSETELAGLEAGLNLEGREVATREITNAISAGTIQPEIANITQLADILRGATRTGATTSTAERAANEQTLAEIVNRIKSTQKGTQSGQVFGNTQIDTRQFNLGAEIPLSFGGT